jgi:hypothetical protein
MLIVGVEPPELPPLPPVLVFALPPPLLPLELLLLLPPHAATANATSSASGNAAHGRMYLLTTASRALGARLARLVDALEPIPSSARKASVPTTA